MRPKPTTSTVLPRRSIGRWPELSQYPDATVFVTEGEKDADNVAALGLCATTVASSNWSDDCVQALAGRDCWIFEDNDDTTFATREWLAADADGRRPSCPRLPSTRASTF